jgi:O-acetyl-ADP-ribose deacetylase (regulator of RNase III)
MANGKVYVIEGNLLESECGIIIHQANCQGRMASGIAKQIVHLYPSVADADRQYHIPVGDRKRMGHTSHAWVDGPYGRLLVVNLYGQFYYGKGLQTEYEAFKRGLRSILARIDILEKKNNTRYKIGLPFNVGCGLAGGDWDIVFEIIKECAAEFKHDLYLYKLV